MIDIVIEIALAACTIIACWGWRKEMRRADELAISLTQACDTITSNRDIMVKMLQGMESGAIKVFEELPSEKRLQ